MYIYIHIKNLMNHLQIVEVHARRNSRFAPPPLNVKSNTIYTTLQLSFVMRVLSLDKMKKKTGNLAIFSEHSRPSVSSLIHCKIALLTDLLSTRFGLLEADKNMER